jgi:hypothetical protein
MRSVAALVGCLSVSFSGILGAQQLPDGSPRQEYVEENRMSRLAPIPVRSPSSTLAMGGVLGAGAGVLAGGVLGGALGFALTHCDHQDGCAGDYANWAFNGAVVGSSVLIPLGVHLANGRQGRAVPALLGSAALGAVGLGVFWGVQKSEGPDALMAASLIATPALQLLSSAAIERATSRRRR